MAKKHGHHGGAWKVAYADFVTAMMALFLVLWLTAQDEKIKEAIERSFKNPFASLQSGSASILQNKDPQKTPSTKGTSDSASSVELSFLRKLSEDLKIQMNEAESSDTMKLELTPDGLRISVFDKSRKPVFRKDSPALTEYGEWILSTVAWQIARFPSFNVELEGHTESMGSASAAELDSWELTSSRANIARKKLLEHGVGRDQIRKVAGFSDTEPMPGIPSEDESNRRVTVMLRVKTKP
jgi:chemotaxis protein MotB